MKAKYAQDDEQFKYREYVTETLRMQGEGMHPGISWTDIVVPKVVDNRSGDEIVTSVLTGAGLKAKGR